MWRRANAGHPVERSHEDEGCVSKVGEPVGVDRSRPLDAQLLQQFDRERSAAEVLLGQHGPCGVEEDRVRLGGVRLGDALLACLVPCEEGRVKPGFGCVKRDQLEEGLHVLR